MIRTTLTATLIIGGLFAAAGHAAADTPPEYTCSPVSSDGHTTSILCDAGPGTEYQLKATYRAKVGRRWVNQQYASPWTPYGQPASVTVTTKTYRDIYTIASRDTTITPGVPRATFDLMAAKCDPEHACTMGQIDAYFGGQTFLVSRTYWTAGGDYFAADVWAGEGGHVIRVEYDKDGLYYVAGMEWL